MFVSRFQVYSDRDVLLCDFGSEEQPIKRLRLSGDWSNGHYDFCRPVDTTIKTQHFKGRPSRPRRNKGGRPKKLKILNLSIMMLY